MTAPMGEFQVEGGRAYNRRSPIRWIISHLLPYPHLPLLLVLASAVNNIAYGNIQVYVGKSFDALLEGGAGALILPAMVMAASALLQGLMGLLRNFSAEVLAQRMERDCREEYYRSLLEKSLSFHGRHRVGDLMARATFDVHALNLMFSPGLMLIVDSAMAYLMPLGMIGLIHRQLLLVPLIFSVFLAFTLWDYNRRLAPISLAQQESFGAIGAEVEESVAGITAVKANVREGYELGKFTGEARVYRDLFTRQGLIQARYWPMLVFVLLYGGALFHGLFLWQRGEVSLGAVIGFMGLFNTFRFVTHISLFSFNTVQHGLAGASRILEVLNTETELDQNREGLVKTIRGQVEFDTVFFNYNRTIVLRRVSFSIRPGMTVAVVGRTGSGKTTLTRMINRIFDPDIGDVYVDGVNLRQWNLESLRSQIGVVEQDTFLFSRSIRENIAFGREDATEEEIQEAARQAQAHDFISSFRDGYDTLVGDRGVSLSGGQRQRISIARAFLTRPRILILDDSTSALDSRTEDEIQKAMRAVSKDRTTFIITHRLGQIRWADHILVMHRGEVVDQGRHEELMQRSVDYRRIFAGISKGEEG